MKEDLEEYQDKTTAILEEIGQRIADRSTSIAFMVEVNRKFRATIIQILKKEGYSYL